MVVPPVLLCGHFLPLPPPHLYQLERIGTFKMILLDQREQQGSETPVDKPRSEACDRPSQRTMAATVQLRGLPAACHQREVSPTSPWRFKRFNSRTTAFLVLVLPSLLQCVCQASMMVRVNYGRKECFRIRVPKDEASIIR